MLRFDSPYKTLSHQRYIQLCLTSLAFVWLFLSSCHIEKRHYRQGFHIEMPSAKHQAENTSVAQREVITYRSIPRKAPAQLQAPIVFEKPYPVQAAEYKPPRPLRKTDDQAGEPETEFTIQEDSPPAGKREPTVHRLAVFSFILGLLALGLAVFVI
ncbi:MAG: hypothetical protein KDD36_08920, partial [Flavobacteriales bacterium]|nr:hypothetical protein [Flavobacteriales bacterium]